MSIFALTAVFILITYAFGVLYAAVSNAYRRCLIAAVGWKGFCILGAIGVPFHEFSHLITALIFNHDVTDFALFRPIKGKKDGNLGYVNHSYNKNSLYQCAGNFFIGAAPMLFGAGFLTFLLYLAVPESIIWEKIAGLRASNATSAAISVLTAYVDALRCYNIFAWLMIIISVFICPHLGMSGADVKNTLSGVIFLLAASIVLPCAIYRYSGVSYDVMNIVIFSFIVRYTYVLIIGLVISLISAFVSKMLNIIK